MAGYYPGYFYSFTSAHLLGGTITTTSTTSTLGGDNLGCKYDDHHLFIFSQALSGEHIGWNAYFDSRSIGYHQYLPGQHFIGLVDT